MQSGLHLLFMNAVQPRLVAIIFTTNRGDLCVITQFQQICRVAVVVVVTGLAAVDWRLCPINRSIAICHAIT